MILLSFIPNGGITNFYAIIVLGMGFTVQETLLLSMANAWLSIGVIATFWTADKIRCRSLAGIPLTVVSIIGAVLVWALPRDQKIARLAGFYLSLAFAIPTFVAMTFLASNIAGRTKKTFVTGMVLVSNCVGNLIGPQTFRDKDAPVYAPALLTFVICNALNLGLLVAMFLYYRWQNRKRDREYGKPIDEDHFVDLTDG
jgi:ACS family allantoate permease-like MFS transporter